MTTQEQAEQDLDYACSQVRALDQEVDYLKDQLATFTDIDIAIEIVKAHGYKVTINRSISHA